MAGGGKVGRNDGCPCGSGKKYKHCCQGKAARLSAAAWMTIAALVVAAGVLVYFVVNAAQSDSSGSTRRGPCPPGQVWSAQHGHCH
ncbi:MAG: hypothetical protein BMS9Abin37_3220 [Acidobacteriota bacterium]|nr:MAG: hypothetical protein BMS9Abin37_3220 [Acidobacteriota bacterium]